MVRIVRLSLAEGVSLPDDGVEIDWPEDARRRPREQASQGSPADSPPTRRRRGRPRKHPPQTDWRSTGTPTAQQPLPQNPADAERRPH